jgi:hypothetical protein
MKQEETGIKFRGMLIFVFVFVFVLVLVFVFVLVNRKLLVLPILKVMSKDPEGLR